MCDRDADRQRGGGFLLCASPATDTAGFLHAVSGRKYNGSIRRYTNGTSFRHFVHLQRAPCPISFWISIMMTRLSLLVLLLLGSQQAHGLRVHLSPEAQRARVDATRRTACAAAAALLATTAGTANAEHRLSFVEARQEEKEVSKP